MKLFYQTEKEIKAFNECYKPGTLKRQAQDVSYLTNDGKTLYRRYFFGEVTGRTDVFSVIYGEVKKSVRLDSKDATEEDCRFLSEMLERKNAA